MTHKPSLTADIREAIYARAGQAFEGAVFLKPREEGGPTNLEFALAPLFLQEVIGANSNYGPRVVFYDAGIVAINGQAHKQLTYLWTATPPGTRPCWQGIRTTLDSRDRPVIWEVLNDSSGAQLVFVTQSVEEDSHKSFGPALPGRRFSMEANLAAATDTVVARVIEDGPVAMGPIVHLKAASGDVMTLICRCMTAQVGHVAATDYYDLRASRGPSPRTPALESFSPLDQRVRLDAGF